jgi:hypothetical protein
MRVIMMFMAAIIGFGVGSILGQPQGYWHGQPEEVEWWAFCTGGCSIAGALLVFFWPARELDRRRKAMPSDHQHNPDPNASAARIERESTAGDKPPPADIEAD